MSAKGLLGAAREGASKVTTWVGRAEQQQSAAIDGLAKASLPARHALF